MVSIDIEDEYARFNDLQTDTDLTRILNDSEEYQRKFLTSSNTSKLSINTNDIWTSQPKPGTGFRPSTKFRSPGTPHRPGTGFRPGSSARLGTTARLGTGIRLGTGYRPGTGFRSITNDDFTRPMTGYGDGMNRPMTAVKGAGYMSSQGRRKTDLLSSSRTPDSNLESPLEESPEVKLRNMENNIMNLIVSSITAASNTSAGELQKALTLAKEASTKERNLIRLQEQAGLNDSHNMDLTFSVIFNLANQYSSNELYTEAVKTYQLITKNRMFPNSNRLKINMGIIYYKLGYFQKAIKMFKMALDQVPTTQKYLRTKIMHNIGILLIKVAKYEDACINFEYIMTEQPDIKAGLHLLLCYFALGNKDKMKRAFTLLLDVQLNIEEDKFVNANMDDVKNDILHKVIETDRLSIYEKQLRIEAESTVLTAAKLIAPMIEDTISAGYDWCIEAVRVSNYYSPLAGNLEINKAIMFLKNRDLQLAIDTLKGFEKQENKVAGAAAANLSFIYYLQKDLINAEKYAQIAIDSDDYRGYGLINMGCVELAKDNRVKAKELFLSASEIDQSSVEAFYNLGLLHKQDGAYEESLECLNQVNSYVPLTPWVLYQLGQVLQHNNDPDAAAEMYNEALGTCPGAPGLFTALADVQEKLHEPQIAYNYYSEAFRYYPSDFNVINWLGSYFINLHLAEKALYYFERAAKLQPTDPKWRLMVASCYRQSGNLHQALKVYDEIHKQFPDNEDCLRYLIRICTDLGLKVKVTEYSTELKRLEKSKEVRERIGSSRPGTSRPGTSRPTSRRSGSGLSSRSGSGQNANGRRSPQILRLSASSKQLPRISSANVDDLRSNSFQSQGSIDASYMDPLGPMESRPRTSAGKPPEDDFADEELGDDLLPE